MLFRRAMVIGASDATLPCLPDFNGTYQSQINTPGDAMKSLLAWAISFNQRIDPHHDRVPLVQRIQTTIHTLVLSTMNPERNTFDAVEAERQWYNILYGHALPFLFDATVGKEKGNMLTSAAEDLHKWLDGLNDNPKEEDVQVLVDKMAKMRLGSRKDRGRKCRSGRNLHRTDRR